MTQSKFPPGWDEEKVRRVLAHYEEQTEKEAVNYLANYIGEDNLLIGSDYGHNDPAEEKQLVETMKSRSDVSAQLIEKILTENPKRFYGLS